VEEDDLTEGGCEMCTARFSTLSRNYAVRPCVFPSGCHPNSRRRSKLAKKMRFVPAYDMILIPVTAWKRE
jgi:hypothetical protein